MERRIDLELLQRERKPRWLALVLLAISVALGGDLFRTYDALEAEVVGKEQRLGALTSVVVEHKRQETRPPVSAEEHESARAIVRRLSTPWGGLFQALEAAQMDRVALLAIEPDAEAGTVNLSGEARDYLAVLSYVCTLEEQKELKRVHLARHELKQGPRERSVAFTISAAWRERP